MGKCVLVFLVCWQLVAWPYAVRADTRSNSVLSPLGVHASQLVEGKAYYIVSYVDSALVVPQVRTVVYLGSNLEGERDGSRYFQDVDSYGRLGSYSELKANKKEEAYEVDLIVTKPDPPPNIFEIDGLVDELSLAAQRLRDRGGQVGEWLNRPKSTAKKPPG